MNSEDTLAKSTRNGVQVIGRAVSILRILRENSEGLSLGQIATRANLARSTVQRIVSALQEERMVIAIGDGGIRLGPELISFAQAAQFDVVEFCRPILTELSAATGETADLSVQRGNKMIFLDQVAGSHRLRTVSAIGETFTLTDTANGRAVLSELSLKEAENLAKSEWGAADHAGNWPKLDAQLNEIRSDGLAYDLDDHSEGICAIGFAFKDVTGVLHAVSVPVPSSRFARMQSAIEEHMRTAKATLLSRI